MGKRSTNNLKRSYVVHNDPIRLLNTEIEREKNLLVPCCKVGNDFPGSQTENDIDITTINIRNIRLG